MTNLARMDETTHRGMDNVRRKWLVLAATSALSVASLSSGASANDAERTVLRATTTVVGSTMSYVQVSIDEPVTVDLAGIGRSDGSTGDVRINGHGRVAGIVLVPDPPPDSLTKDFLVAGRFARCGQPGCGPGRRPMTFEVHAFGDEANGRATLSPGDYRLYLLADGQPVQVTLRLHGLDGTTTIQPSRPASADFRSPEQTLVSSSAEPYFAAGDTFRAGVRGLILTALWARAEQEQDYLYGVCHQGDISSAPPEAIYGPHCEALAALTGGLTFVETTRSGKGFDTILATTYTESPAPESGGKVGFGAWISASGPIKSSGFHGLFLSWDD